RNEPRAGPLVLGVGGNHGRKPRRGRRRWPSARDDRGMAVLGAAARIRCPMSAFSARDFPRLTPSNHRLTSPIDANYNCIAWAAGDVDHWWQPGRYWPTSAPHDDFSIAVLEQAFRALGYEDCGGNESLEVSFEKVAIYGNNMFYTHAAKQ